MQTPGFGVAVIGCGKWGVNHVRSAHRILGDRLRIVCDVSEASLAQAKSVAPSVRTTKAISDILDDNQIEAVIIASGAETHYAIGKQCLEAGKHCLIEKPLTLHSEEAVELVETAHSLKRVLMVGHLLLFHPAITLIKNEISTGSLGEIMYLYSKRVNLGTIRRQENAFWSLAPHDISVMLYLTDKMPVAVSAVGGRFIRKNLPDVVFFNLEFEESLLAHGHVSWLDPHKMRTFTIVGTRKMIIFDDMVQSEKIKIFDKGVGFNVENGDILSPQGMLELQSHSDGLKIREGDVHMPRIANSEPLRIEQEHFFKCIETGAQPLTDGRSGLNVLKVMEAAQQSLDKGGIPIELSLKKPA